MLWTTSGSTIAASNTTTTMPETRLSNNSAESDVAQQFGRLKLLDRKNVSLCLPVIICEDVDSDHSQHGDEFGSAGGFDHEMAPSSPGAFLQVPRVDICKERRPPSLQ